MRSVGCNQHKVLYIIRSTPCISSTQSVAYHQFLKNCISSSRKFFRYTPYGVMRYKALCALMIYTHKRDDIPSLSRWIKKQRSDCFVVFWRRRRGSPGATVAPARTRACRTSAGSSASASPTALFDPLFTYFNQ